MSEVARSEAFCRARRLGSRKDFGRAYTTGTKRFGRYFVVFARQNGTAFTRLGITATKKVGGAVVRNRLKRIVREIFRRESVGDGYDVVVNVRREAVPVAFETLRSDLSPLLLRLTKGPVR